MHPTVLHHMVVSSSQPHADLLLSMEAERCAHLLPEAGARSERTLAGVAYTPWLGAAQARRNAPVAPWRRRHAPTGSPAA